MLLNHLTLIENLPEIWFSILMGVWFIYYVLKYGFNLVCSMKPATWLIHSDCIFSHFFFKNVAKQTMT